MKLTLMLLVIAGVQSAIAAPPTARTTAYDRAVRAKEMFPRELLERLTYSSFAVREIDGLAKIVITLPDETALDYATRNLPREYRGVDVHLELVPYAEFQAKDDNYLALLLLAAQIRAEADGFPPNERPNMLGVAKCDVGTGELNNGAKNTTTAPCIAIYAPSVRAMRALKNYFGRERDGVTLVHVLSSPMPATMFAAEDAESPAPREVGEPEGPIMVGGGVGTLPSGETVMLGARPAFPGPAPAIVREPAAVSQSVELAAPTANASPFEAAGDVKDQVVANLRASGLQVPMSGLAVEDRQFVVVVRLRRAEDVARALAMYPPGSEVDRVKITISQHDNTVMLGGSGRCPGLDDSTDL